ncbi:IS3 family transposase [Candidatus Methylospira mobilis]|uniref:IS3 family transposase n=1 Tax=Candidatus Methylospira mobilis TaxID=1808979 RepID=A0A5Q0BKX6_9GAMM|nr:IS3 family transposase [Candidatus Methylospira mobilis]
MVAGSNPVVPTKFKKSRGSYGTRRLKIELGKRDIHLSRRRIGRLMRQADLRCKTRRRFKATTNSQHNLPVAANPLGRQFSVQRPNQAYVGDIPIFRRKKAGCT